MKSDIFETLDRMKKVPVKSINLSRATRFREYTIEKMKSNSLGLIAILPRTIARRKANLGGVLYDTAELAEDMKAKNIGQNAEAGYYSDDTKKHSGSSATSHDIAVIHSTHTKKPRPFLLNSAVRFEYKEDDLIIDQVFEKWWANV